MIEVTAASVTFTACINVVLFIVCNLNYQLIEIHGTDTFFEKLSDLTRRLLVCSQELPSGPYSELD